ncbi:MAG: carbohydrate kinase family protein [Patescibacteria group bacterium]|nr:carbohydrate kinase family protein [Patescibacteria group bacterium]
MSYDIITIGDVMRDIFVFPDIDDMEKPVSDEEIESEEHFEKFLVFGLGDKIEVSDVSFSIGGTAANVAAGLSKSGFKTGLISAVGGDNIGSELVLDLRSKKVGVENLKNYKLRKSSFSVIVSYKGERTIFVYHAFTPEDFILPKEINASWVYLGPMAKGFERVYNQVTNQVIKNNLRVAINPGSIQINAGLEYFGGLKELMEVIFLNREEAQLLSGLPGTPQVKDIAKAINLRGPKTVVITDGKEGAYAYSEEKFLKVGIYPGHRLDATGAGDAFASGFLSAKMKELSLQECLKWGVVNSASVVGKIGAQEGLLSSNTIKRKVKEYHWPQESLRFS